MPASAAQPQKLPWMQGLRSERRCNGKPAREVPHDCCLSFAAASMGRDGSGALPRVPSTGVVMGPSVVVTSSRDGPAGTGGGSAQPAGGMRPPPVTSPAAAARQGSGSPNSAQPSPRQVRRPRVGSVLMWSWTYHLMRYLHRSPGSCCL